MRVKSDKYNGEENERKEVGWKVNRFKMAESPN